MCVCVPWLGSEVRVCWQAGRQAVATPVCLSVCLPRGGWMGAGAEPRFSAQIACLVHLPLLPLLLSLFNSSFLLGSLLPFPLPLRLSPSSSIARSFFFFFFSSLYLSREKFTFDSDLYQKRFFVHFIGNQIRNIFILR